MSYYRIMERGLWGDERIQRISANARGVFAYLCVNEHDHLSGIYRLPLPFASYDTGRTIDELKGCLGELEAVGLAFYDPGSKVIWVANMFAKQARSQSGAIGATHVASCTNQLSVLPRTPLKGKMVAYYAEHHGVTIPHHMPPGNPIDGGGGSPRSVSVSVSASESELDPEPKGKRKRRTKSTKPGPEADEYQLAVLEMMKAALRTIRPKARGPGPNPVNLQMIDKPRLLFAASLEDWQRVISAQATNIKGQLKRAETKERRDQLMSYMTLTTLHRPQNFARNLDSEPPPDDHPGGGPDIRRGRQERGVQP